MNSESSIVLPVLGISKFGDGRCVLRSVGHAHGGGVCERGKGARGHPGTWESHLVLRTLAGKMVATGLPTTRSGTGAPSGTGVCRQAERRTARAQAQ